MLPSRPLSIAAITALLVGCGAAQPQPTPPAPDVSALANGYLDALEARDLDAAARLFGPRSSIVETGRDEGDWGRYASHHLGPELGAVRSFEIDRRPLDAGGAGDLAFAIFALEYRIELQDGRTMESVGAVTFVADRAGLRHVHWSSRERRGAAHTHHQDGADPPPPNDG